MAMALETQVEIWIEIYIEASSGKRRARPVRDQGYADDTNVECSKKMRYDFPVGTRHLVKAKLTDREGGKPYLLMHHTWVPIRTILPENKNA